MLQCERGEAEHSLDSEPNPALEFHPALVQQVAAVSSFAVAVCFFNLLLKSLLHLNVSAEEKRRRGASDGGVTGFLGVREQTFKMFALITAASENKEKLFFSSLPHTERSFSPLITLLCVGGGLNMKTKPTAAT